MITSLIGKRVHVESRGMLSWPVVRPMDLTIVEPPRFMQAQGPNKPDGSDADGHFWAAADESFTTNIGDWAAGEPICIGPPAYFTVLP